MHLVNKAWWIKMCSVHSFEENPKIKVHEGLRVWSVGLMIWVGAEGLKIENTC